MEQLRAVCVQPPFVDGGLTRLEYTRAPRLRLNVEGVRACVGGVPVLCLFVFSGQDTPRDNVSALV